MMCRGASGFIGCELVDEDGPLGAKPCLGGFKADELWSWTSWTPFFRINHSAWKPEAGGRDPDPGDGTQTRGQEPEVWRQEPGSRKLEKSLHGIFFPNNIYLPNLTFIFSCIIEGKEHFRNDIDFEEHPNFSYSVGSWRCLVKRCRFVREIQISFERTSSLQFPNCKVPMVTPIETKRESVQSDHRRGCYENGMKAPCSVQHAKWASWTACSVQLAKWPNGRAGRCALSTLK
ncbi:hypothetical protein DY000_02015789 [Brassica cretica]|uniref:Uncharacterized protein n=1 Tax=Brassica cretica TaxID=69181 RepID=A0ABQ7CVF8_BRACR|nr:hypothetical protein DY000_02015789 [Brassica cretica]